jgi:uncharacterized phage protein (TIGR01671 family)
MIPKFRVWDKETKSMWNIERWHVEDEYFDLIEPNKSVVDLNASRVQRKQSDVILMQSTGLFDINDKEIFEGDIVRITMQIGKRTTTSIGAVAFDKIEVCFKIRNELGGHYVTMFHARYFEVIGEIAVHWVIKKCSTRLRSCSSISRPFLLV